MFSDGLHEDSPAWSAQEESTLIARVDLDQLAQNLTGLRQVAPGLGLLAVVKADAYGHGAVPVARALAAAGIDGFCVATLHEALELRRGGVAVPILVFGALRAQALPLAAANQLELTVVSAAHLAELAPHLPQHPVGLHLKLDTGMGRSGILLGDLGACCEQLQSLRPFLRGVMGHFSASEEPTANSVRLQRDRFQGALAQLRNAGIAPPMIHHANSAGCLRGFVAGDTHARCGIALYGLSEVREAAAAGLRPILELTAEVMRVQDIPAGATVGYGSTFVAPHPLRLATLSCGYADGYSRALSNRAQAGFRGHTYPVVGRVSMDLLTVALPESVELRPGQSMSLLSRNPEDPHSVQHTARLLGTIPYEVTCALNRRVARTYS